ncbi:hypothetical protein MBAV_001945 [Candidatus Magnetobacterium bavaricum]|uniref:Uncharacterized protein n=1 Tax=Candidatus Magnetobacterium bavaricum TaxID=29290 RepID=A0A0F3GV68_9BACT|nr:hypothetical protein MBAV_001941 [Candidatus Magnetobacterium bavaricum]KJU85864.1 hypothetical protein MBAV_001945 [Candidatus Magnetobacterium bavaricum]
MKMNPFRWINGYKDRITDFMPKCKDYYFECLFLVALIYHDAGHYPFSHTLEFNHDIDIEGTHEERLFDLINEGFEESEFDKIPLPCTDKKKGQECFISSLKFLIAHEDFNCNCLPKKCDYDYYYIRLRVLQKLVSGFLDLDRIDHYLRDSFFTGVKLANFNIEYLLRGMMFRIKDSGGKEEFDLCLNKDALIHAKGLLYSKEQINDAIFENPELINYEIILNHCITKYVKDKDKDKDENKTINETIEDIYKMEDWKLLGELEKFDKNKAYEKNKKMEEKNFLDELYKPNESNKEVDNMFNRLKTKKPLFFIGKFTLKGNYDVDFGEEGNAYWNYRNDPELISALKTLYDFILGFCIESLYLKEDVLYANDIVNFIKKEIYDEYIGYIRTYFPINTTNECDAIKNIMKYLLFHSKTDKKEENIEFIKKRKKLYDKIGSKTTRILFNNIKREFINKMKNIISDNNIDIDLYAKFSKKFLDFYDLSHDVVDLSEIVISNSGRKLGEDYSEKEFLRMFAGRDIKSRNNLWLYTTYEINDNKRKTIVEILDKCGFNCTRSS